VLDAALWRRPVDLDTLIVATYCLIDDALPAAVAGPLRRRGPAPKLTDAEVLTLEVVGEFLGLDHDTAIYAFFRQHDGSWFPTLTAIHRSHPSDHVRAASGQSLDRQSAAVAGDCRPHPA
jgi:hypothetical protein